MRRKARVRAAVPRRVEFLHSSVLHEADIVALQEYWFDDRFRAMLAKAVRDAFEIVKLRCVQALLSENPSCRRASSPILFGLIAFAGQSIGLYMRSCSWLPSTRAVSAARSFVVVCSCTLCTLDPWLLIVPFRTDSLSSQ
jgi:hypothetical protein